MTSKPITMPTNAMSWEEFYEKTENANKLMDRVWYCIACSDSSVSQQKIFWEHWYWKEGEDKKDLMNSAVEACNHTLTIDTDGKEVDYPVWPLKFTKKSFKMYPAIDLGCAVIAPIGMSMTPVAFPTDDSRTEFRVDCTKIMGKVMYFVFVLDPNMSEENKKKNFDKLEKENGVLREWFHDVSWEGNYPVGSTGEPDINPK
mmetsp:Transcript_32516/g.37659  ORF Transcript_32516/g.37659 Transcript_32516/m.37659 type:complete len:201 (-) Transcript_32516:124-726(-)|eukprot:CAMPEP_0194380744 /NCGR_PEP_ID=MMETSP0174-20130528/47455_1 /TAXON_ID=216777 /ORGANISM="Proboscia alata, Strain PI-D3" /LENGTH=200 /DNA_ID=CAMNT_0039164403 /DNA_START=165 /DNA_END=767 /DNA_ORIENTATION=-